MSIIWLDGFVLLTEELFLNELLFLDCVEFLIDLRLMQFSELLILSYLKNDGYYRYKTHKCILIKLSYFLKVYCYYKNVVGHLK